MLLQKRGEIFLVYIGTEFESISHFNQSFNWMNDRRNPIILANNTRNIYNKCESREILYIKKKITSKGILYNNSFLLLRPNGGGPVRWEGGN